MSNPITLPALTLTAGQHTYLTFGSLMAADVTAWLNALYAEYGPNLAVRGYAASYPNGYTSVLVEVWSAG